MGFVSEVCAGGAWERALEMARVIGGKSPVAVEGTKELIDWGVGRPVGDGELPDWLWEEGGGEGFG